MAIQNIQPQLRRCAELHSQVIATTQANRILMRVKNLEKPKMFSAQIVARLKSDEERYVRERAEREDRSISSVIRCLVNEARQAERQQQHQAA